MEVSLMERDERAPYCPLCGLLAPDENPHQECVDQELAYMDSWPDTEHYPPDDYYDEYMEAEHE